MKSHTSKRFREAFAELPEHVRRQGCEAYKRFREDPSYPGLRFKRIHPTRPIYSARISDDYRAVGVREGDEVTWFWIGTHAEYDHLIANLWRSVP